MGKMFLFIIKIIPHDVRYAVGLVTWGVNCAQTDVPGVYADVAYFANWINNCPNPRRAGDYSLCNSG